jgi:hypothetical protein
MDTPLFWIHTYTDVDRAFWAEHLEAWVPARLFDSHVHIMEPALQIETISDEQARAFWVMELQAAQEADTAARCMAIVYPGREVSCLSFGMPTLGWDIERGNLYVSGEAARRGWQALAVVRPTWVAEQVAWYLAQPAVIGVKPYYATLGYDRSGRDAFQEVSIFDFLPPHQLEVLDARAAWLTLHVPRAGRLGDPDNQRELRALRRRYPRIRLVIAHYGRSYTVPHALEGIVPLADDPGIYMDTSAVLNPEVHYLALKHLGPTRILYGTDNPIFYLRGRRQWAGRSYINRTNYPFHFNTVREAPEIEATYTLYMYEALKALKDACTRLGLGREAVEAIFWGNAQRLMQQGGSADA